MIQSASDRRLAAHYDRTATTPLACPPSARGWPPDASRKPAEISTRAHFRYEGGVDRALISVGDDRRNFNSVISDGLAGEGARPHSEGDSLPGPWFQEPRCIPHK